MFGCICAISSISCQHQLVCILQQHIVILIDGPKTCQMYIVTGKICSVLQVPVWDMLNHITGCCNVRLHHSSKQAALQMIATQAVAAGEEVVNNYGPLSDAELLRRFGFVESTGNPHNGCEIPLAMLLATWQARDEAQEAEHMVNNKLEFLRQHAVVSRDGWLSTDPHGVPQPELIEVVRLLALSAADFVAFEKQVRRWHCPVSRPLTTLLTVPPVVASTIRVCVTERLTKLRLPDDTSRQALGSHRVKVAEHVLCIERDALKGLCTWLDQQNGSDLAALCRQVWSHVREDSAT